MITKLFEILAIGVMPLNAVRLKHGSDELHLLFLEGESSYAFNEIVRPTMHGGARLVGHRFSATLYIPQNHLVGGMTALTAFAGKVLETVECDFGKNNADVANYLASYNIQQTLNIQQSLELAWRLENTELRPRFIVSLNGFCFPTNLSVT